jgi:hypothetical protein
LFEDVGTSACHVDALTTVSFEAHRLPLSILLWHPSPIMMIDLTAAGKPPLTPFRSAPSPRTATRQRREFATPKAIIAKLEQPSAVAAALSHGGPDERQRRKSKR